MLPVINFDLQIMTVINKHVSKLFAENVTQPILLNKINVEPSSARWLYWFWMIDNSFCFEKKIAGQK